MKKRLISLLLAFSMMLTFLPAGAVSAFAEAGETIGEATIVPTPGHLIATQGGDWIAFITQPGTYYLSGDYARKIGVRTTDDNADVTIKIVGNITYSGPENVLIQVENVHDLKVETDGPYTINVPGSGSNGIALLIWSQNGSTLVKGGIYKNCMFKLHHRRTELEDVTVETNNSAIWNYGSDVILTRGSYTSNGGPVIENSETTYNTSVYGNLTVNGAKITNTAGSAIVNYDSSKVTINSGTVIESTANCINNQGNGTTLEVNGGNFTSLEDYPAVYNNGKAYIHGGTFTSMGSVIANNGAELIVDEESAETVICNTNTEERGGVRCDGTGKTEINGGTIKDAAYGIWVRNGSPNVTLKNADQLGKTYNVYLSKNQKITIDDAYTKEVTVKCADPYDQRPITNATTGTNQKKLNIKLMDEGYLVGYNKTADGKEYRCLSKLVGVTINGLEGEIKAEDSAEFTVTLDHEGSTGTGILTFGDKNGEIEYKDEHGAYQPMPKDGREVDLSGDKNDYVFHITPKNAGEQTLTAAVVRDDVKLGTAEEDYTVAGRVHTAVTIEGLENAVIKEGESKDFTVKVTPNDDANLGEAFIDFGDKNSEIEYKDEHGAYQPMPKDGLEVDLSGDNKNYEFRITPKDAGDQTLTAAVVRDAVELGTADKNFTVAGRVHTAVTIEGLENAVIKEGESKDFTVKVDPKDDANLGEAFIDFGDKNSEIEYKDEHGAYQPMPNGGLKINLGNGEVEHEFRITPKETGKQTLTAVVKKDEKELAKDEKDFVVSEMPILTLKDGVITSVTVPGKNGADPEDITEIVKKNANEDGSFHVPEGATVSVAFDKDAFADSGLKFGHWDITGLDDPNAYQDKESFAFEMPAKAVTLKAMTQDASIEDDEPDIVGPIVIGTTVVVGGAVLGYQAYSLGAEFAGKLMALPYFPSNRSALAMMLWEDAGKPMPESELLYPDVEQEEQDMGLQHAARWAMENELIPDLNDEGTAPEEMKFYPDNTVSKIDVLNAWQKAQELKQNA